MKKILFLIVAAIVVVAMPNVKAAEPWLGKVEASVGNDTLKEGNLPAAIGSETENASVTYDSVKLKYVPEVNSETIKRPGPMAWVGIKVTAPSEVNSKELAQKAKYYPVGDESNPRVFFDKRDSKGDDAPYYIYLYDSVTQEELEEACKKGIEKLELGKWVFTWDEKGEHKQKFTIYINTKTVTLINEKDENLFTPTDAEKLINEYNESKKQQETKTEEVKDNTKNPNTSDTIIYSVIAITISAIGLVFTYKKLHNN